MSNGTPPPPPGAAPNKKGLSTWAWVAIGCGGLVVVCLVAFLALGAFAFNKGKKALKEATGVDSMSELVEGLQDDPVKTAAEMAIRLNPDLDLVSTDDDAGTITFRNKKTGEEATLNFEDIAEGRFSMTTAEGEFSVDAADAEQGGVTFKGPEGETRIGGGGQSDVPDWVPLYPGASTGQTTFRTETATEISGAVTAESSDDAQTVLDHYKGVFEDGGWAITNQSMTRSGDGAFGAITGESAPDGRTLNVVIIEQEGASQVSINYNQKKR